MNLALKRLLIIGYTWPEPDSTAAGQRMMQLVETFLVDDYDITFCSAAMETEHSMDLESLGVTKRNLTLNSDSFDVLVGELNPDIVLFDRFLTEEQFGWRVVENAPKALRILDTEDLHSLRQVRERLVKEGKEFTLNSWLQDEKTLRELASIYRCDFSLIISSYEMELLQKTVGVPSHLLLHLPFMVSALPQKPDWPKFSERQDFMFIGGGRHAPNLDAIEQLSHTIWPMIRQHLPDARLHIYGAYLPQHIWELHQPQKGFLVHGRVTDLEGTLQQARVCLAPLRFGAGIKGKLLQAMYTGTPSVTTPLGAEGMFGNLPWNGTITGGTTDFVKKAVHLYTNQEAWLLAQKAGINLVNTLYAKAPLRTRLLKTIKDWSRHLEDYRNQNVIGRMLQHQSLASTKFMGKWIEAKNKKS